YEARRPALAGLGEADPSALLEERADGRVKMFVAHRALKTRAALRDVYERGEYLPLQTTGARSECLFAFARESESGGAAITCVPRLVATLAPAGTAPLGDEVWSDTRIIVSDSRAVRDVFTGAIVRPERT